MTKKIIWFFCLLYNLSFFSQPGKVGPALQDSASIGADNFPLFNIGGSDIEAGINQQDVSSLLQSGKDVFNQFAGFQFAAARYRTRGYAAGSQQVMVNGVSVNDAETGGSSWSSWGGLNDVTRFVETRFGNTASRYGFSSAGGYSNIDSRASSFKKGTRFSYANADKIFRNRLMLTYASGMMRNGWAFAFSASNRSGSQLYVPGTYVNASSFYAAVDKRLNEKHLLGLTAFMAPIEQGLSSAEPLAVYELAGNPYYNSLWGFQAGRARNAAVSTTAKPLFILSDTWQISPLSRLTSSLYYHAGKAGVTGLNWNNAPDPRPDYYYYLPAYSYGKGNVSAGDLVTRQWQSDVNTRQIDWDKLIAMNQANLFTVPSQMGQGINTSETRARYIVENRIAQVRQLGFNSVYNRRSGDLFFSMGMNGNLYRSRKYKQMDDLLGAAYWLDYDQFAQNLGVDHTYEQNDLAHPDKKIRKGDRFGYDYLVAVNHAEAWVQAEQSFKKADVCVAASLAETAAWREGFMANGKFPNSSKGKSARLDFFNQGVKAGLTYKLSGRQFITVNGNYTSKAPDVSNLFLSPHTRNQTVDGLRNALIFAADVNYIINLPAFKFRLTGYYTQSRHQSWLRTYYNDLYATNVNLVMKNINQLNEGLELGIEKTLFVSHVLQGALGCGRFFYTNRPTLEAWQDNNAAPLFRDRTAYLKNYYTGYTPQLVAGLGYKYNAVRHWSAGLYLNYFDRLFVEPNPDRRTYNALSAYLNNESAQYAAIVKQQRLPAYFLLNVNASKSLRVMKKYNLNFSLSVNNLLNNKKILVSGYEQLRWDAGDINRFANKYNYLPGATYMAMINFNF